ncbi:cell division cycle-associated protein 7-like [Chenopodium quinoa]|nr:cell division cycle-associated protein 7-like [Chenopodium quinoa]
MAITRRSAVAKHQLQATPPPLPPVPPPPPVAEITPKSNNNSERPQQQEQPQKEQQPAVVAETVSNYEQTREHRIKENRERLQKLGIVDLSLQLKSIVATKRTPRRTQFDRNTPLKSPPSGPTERRRSSRLQNAPPVTYTEPKEEKPKRGRDIVLEEGAKPEIYTEEHEKLLGNTEMPWTFFVDGYRADGTRIYDPVSGKTCHQCRQKTLGQRTRCSKCNLVQGQFCGDCLMMRYGEHVVEANQNPDWICPPCRGICNCSLCRQARGWCPTGALYKRISNLGYKSVAHYLITTKRAPPDAENSSDASQPVKRSLPFEGMELPNDTVSDDKAVVENTELNPQSENKATLGESDPKSKGVGRPRKRSKKENTDAGEELVTVSEDSVNAPVPNMNGPKSSTPSVDELNPKLFVRRSGRRSVQENVDVVGEMSVESK